MKKQAYKDILTLTELKLPEWQERARKSVEVTYNPETGEATAQSEAQEALLNFILNMGGVRREVYEYLLQPRFHDAALVPSIGMLLCYGAPIEWIRLAVEALEENKITGTLYVNEITEGYKEGIPVEKMEQMLNETNTVFELCQHRLSHTIPQTERKQQEDSVYACKIQQEDGKKEKEEEQAAPSGIKEENMAKVITEAVLTALKNTSRNESVFIGETENNKVKCSEKEKNTQSENAISVGNTSKQKPASVKQDAGNEITEESRAGNMDIEERVPEDTDSEILSKRMLVTDLEQAEKKHGERISFYQILLSRHMKKVFEKMDPKSQEGKIFEIMVQKKYNKEKILAIRRLMKGGMSNEFIFSLLEKDLPEEELMELCDTLIEDMPEENVQEFEEEEA